MNAKKLLLDYAEGCRESARNWMEISKATDDPGIAQFALERAADNAKQAEKQEKLAEMM